MKIVAYRSSMPFDNRSDGSDQASISPSTSKSILPSNNTLTFQDILSGEQKIGDYYPHAGGDWSPGKDTEKNYREEGDGYKRESRDTANFSKLLDGGNQPLEKWKLKIGKKGTGGSIFFTSFPAAQEYARENNIQMSYISRIAQTAQTAQNDEDKRLAVITDAFSKTFMVESIDAVGGVKETGSAFCIKKNHYITCAHVIKRYNKNNIEDTTSFYDTVINIIQNGQLHRANLVNFDLAKDIAIIRCDDLNVNPFEIDKGMIVGEDVIAIGSPHGYENNVSVGTIGSLNRKIFDYENAPTYMFVNMAVFPGNSGGPIIKVDNGKLIGMVTMVISGKDESSGLNAGLPSNYIEEFLLTSTKEVVNKQ